MVDKTIKVANFEHISGLSNKLGHLKYSLDLRFVALTFVRMRTFVRQLGGGTFVSSEASTLDHCCNTSGSTVGVENKIFTLVEPSSEIVSYKIYSIFVDNLLIGALVIDADSDLPLQLSNFISHIQYLLMKSRYEFQLKRREIDLKYKLLEVESLIDIVETLNQASQLNREVYDEVLFSITSVLNASKGMILLKDSDVGVFSLVSSFNIEDRDVSKRVITDKRGTLKQLRENGVGMILTDFDKAPFIPPVVKNALICPLSDHYGLVGCVILLDKESRYGYVNFTTRDLRLCESLSGKISLVHNNFSLISSLDSTNKLVESIMSSVTTSIIKVNKFGEIEYINQSTERLFGFNQSEIKDQHIAVVFENNTNLIEICGQVEKHPQKLFLEDISISDALGRLHQVNLTVVPVINETEDLDGFVFSIEDLSDLNKIKSTFKKYVSENIVDEVLRNDTSLELGGAQQKVCVLFCDIRGFTAMSERMAPNQVVYLLNHYFESMIDVVFRYGGTLDKIIGDELMVLYGVPKAFKDDIDNAINTAFGMFDALKEFNKKFSSEGYPRLEVGIGINYGAVVCGNIGSKRQMNFTVIGDEVNLASRLCSNASPGELLISKSVFERTRMQSHFRARSALKVKGKKKEVEVWMSAI